METRPGQRNGVKSRLKIATHLVIAAILAAVGKPFARRLKKAAAWENSLAEQIVEAEFDQGMAGEIRKFTNPGPEFEELDVEIAKQHAPRVKAIAYYLPQFHEIPENNEWWGKGFTEWRNVARGAPRFRGHYQPRIPRDLGFYTLTDANVLKRQAEYAKAGGLSGFCFYHYWFSGKRLLHRPVDILRENPAINIEYCLMWANESWTRRWDERDDNILMAQEYHDRDDAAFVENLHHYFQDPRYIRLNNRPLFFIYRPNMIDGLARKLSRWRKLFEKKFEEIPLFFMAQTAEANPSKYGLDGAIEFPPHKLVGRLKTVNHHLSPLDQGFRGKVYSYDAFMNAAVSEPVQKYPLIKTACPSWDNDARRQGGGTVVHGSTPAKYEKWLRHCVDYALQNPTYGESIVAINAWNEWAEAAYLEPDIYYGAAYLNATARALCGSPIQSAAG